MSCDHIFFYWRTLWMSRNVLNTYIMGLRCDFAPTQPFKVPRLTKNSSKQLKIAKSSILKISSWETFFHEKFNFAAISSLLRVVWPQFFYWRTPWMSRSVLNTYTMGLRCDLAPTQPFKVPRLTKNSSKHLKIAKSSILKVSSWEAFFHEKSRCFARAPVGAHLV